MARKMLGSVDLLGLNSYGNVPSGSLNPLWGVAIGGGVSAVTSIAVGHATSGKLAANRELVGLAAGLASAGILYSMKSTRAAAVGAALGAVVGAGLALFEKHVLGTVQLPTATAAAAAGAVSGMGIANIQALNGLGMAQINQLNGLGVANISRVPRAQGTIPGVAGLGGVAGLQAVRPGTMPANLLGASTNASRQVSLMGGPAIHNIASHYGATTVGGGR